MSLIGKKTHKGGWRTIRFVSSLHCRCGAKFEPSLQETCRICGRRLPLFFYTVRRKRRPFGAVEPERPREAGQVRVATAGREHMEAVERNLRAKAQELSFAPTTRAFAGFDLERATYERHKVNLLHEEGKYVVIRGDEILPPQDSYEDALRLGYACFGPGPLYVKQILAVEAVATTTRTVSPCPI